MNVYVVVLGCVFSRMSLESHSLESLDNELLVDRDSRLIRSHVVKKLLWITIKMEIREMKAGVLRSDQLKIQVELYLEGEMENGNWEVGAGEAAG